MPFSIDEFVSNLNQKNLSKKTHFKVLITGPLSLNSTNDEQDMVFRCESTTEPGRNIVTVNNSYFYGLPLARAAGSTFSEIKLSFILSEDYSEKQYFESWQDLMVGPYRNNNISQSMFDIGYFNDYAGTLNIMRYNELEDMTYKMVFKYAFPTIVGDIDLDWSDENPIAKLPVTFYYQYYTDLPTTDTAPPDTTGTTSITGATG